MLRIYFPQHWYSLSDEGGGALYDSIGMRSFAGIDLSPESAGCDHAAEVLEFAAPAWTYGGQLFSLLALASLVIARNQPFSDHKSRPSCVRELLNLRGFHAPSNWLRFTSASGI